MSALGYAIIVIVMVGGFWFFGVDGYITWFDFLDCLKSRKERARKSKERR